MTTNAQRNLTFIYRIENEVEGFCIEVNPGMEFIKKAILEAKAKLTGNVTAQYIGVLKK